jgi:hypothetical protein
VLLDRDGTLVVDVPYNGDPELVRPVTGAVEALRMLRAAGIPTAVPIATPTTMSAQSPIRGSRSVATSATPIPAAAISLPRTAVRGPRTIRRPPMNIAKPTM